MTGSISKSVARWLVVRFVVKPLCDVDEVENEWRPEP
jgi:hypothetical protein